MARELKTRPSYPVTTASTMPSGSPPCSSWKASCRCRRPLTGSAWPAPPPTGCYRCWSTATSPPPPRPAPTGLIRCSSLPRTPDQPPPGYAQPRSHTCTSLSTSSANPPISSSAPVTRPGSSPPLSARRPCGSAPAKAWSSPRTGSALSGSCSPSCPTISSMPCTQPTGTPSDPTTDRTSTSSAQTWRRSATTASP
jgi:hypothetical protein